MIVDNFMSMFSMMRNRRLELFYYQSNLAFFCRTLLVINFIIEICHLLRWGIMEFFKNPGINIQDSSFPLFLFFPAKSGKNHGVYQCCNADISNEKILKSNFTFSIIFNFHKISP